MWRSRLPLGLLVVIASCQPTDDGDLTDPLGEVPPISDFPRSGGNSTVSPVTAGSGSEAPPSPPASAGGSTSGDPRVPTAPGSGAPPATMPPPATAPMGGGAIGLDAGAGWSGDAGLSQPADAAADAGASDDAAPDASNDAGCPGLLAPDSGACSGYGCAVWLDPLRAGGDTRGACSAQNDDRRLPCSPPWSQCSALPAP